MIRDAQGVLTLFLRSADPPADTCTGNTVTAEQAPEHKVRQVTTQVNNIGQQTGLQNTTDDKRRQRLTIVYCGMHCGIRYCWEFLLIH